MRPLPWLSSAVVLPVLPALVGCNKADASAAAPREAAAPVHVTTTPVVDRNMPEQLTLTGTLRSSVESDVAADVSGKIVATYVERGQPVKKGQILAIVDSRVAAFAATAAAAQSKVAQEQLDEARR